MTSPFTRVFRTAVERFWLLPLGAAIAVLWANTLPESYFRMAHRLAFGVNEIGMAVFVAWAAQDVGESLRPGGPLHTWRRWSLPLVVAVGGCLGSAAVFLLEVRTFEYAFVSGWPAAMVVDLGLVYFVTRNIFGRGAAVPFVLAVSIVTGAVSIAALTWTHPSPPVHASGSIVMAAALLSALWMRHARVESFLPYFLVSGTLSWFALYLGGFHPAFAMVPIVPFLPHVRRSLSRFIEAPDDPDDPRRHGEHVWAMTTQIVLFFFALVNAGAVIGHTGHGTWSMLSASFIGRPLGMAAGMMIGAGLGLYWPARLGWRDMVVAALATSSGFTFALFFATAMYGPGPLLTQLRLGALGSIAGMGLAYGAAWMLGVGRFKARTPHGRMERVAS